jgi:hypothetical protein
MVMGTSRTGADEMALWADEVGAVAVSVEYRLAPEHPHPALVEDCYAGLVWTAQHAEELGIDPSRLVIAGASAGGGLAAGTALMARDRGGPALSHQILMCPMLDDRGITPSSQELDGEGIWDRTANLVGWTALLGDARGGPDVSPYAVGRDVPGRGHRLRGPAVPGRGAGRVPPVAGRVPRVRHVRPAVRPGPGLAGHPAGLRAPGPGLALNRADQVGRGHPQLGQQRLGEGEPAGRGAQGPPAARA